MVIIAVITHATMTSNRVGLISSVNGFKSNFYPTIISVEWFTIQICGSQRLHNVIKQLDNGLFSSKKEVAYLKTMNL